MTSVRMGVLVPVSARGMHKSPTSEVIDMTRARADGSRAKALGAYEGVEAAGTPETACTVPLHHQRDTVQHTTAYSHTSSFPIPRAVMPHKGVRWWHTMLYVPHQLRMSPGVMPVAATMLSALHDIQSHNSICTHRASVAARHVSVSATLRSVRGTPVRSRRTPPSAW